MVNSKQNQYNIKVNDLRSYDLEVKDNQIFLNGSELDNDILHLGANSYSVIVNNNSYKAEIKTIDYNSKEVVLTINGQQIKLKLKDRFDTLVKSMGLSATPIQKFNQLNAPMPGLVLDILAKEGQEIKKGETLLIMEAMKMENSLAAPADVTIKSIEIKVGDKIDKNQILISFE